MQPLLAQRTPHPIQDARVALANRHAICERRGYCGPFINEEFYRAYPGWEGYGDCLVCGSTVCSRARAA
jgi:hypothetical protein